MLAGFAATWGGYNRQMLTTEATIVELRAAVKDMPQLGDRVQAAEVSIAGLNRRIDDMFGTFSTRLDRNAETTAQGFAAVTSAIAGLDTRVAVLAQRFEMMNNPEHPGR